MKDKLLKHSGILTFSTVVGGGIGYIYQILVGRLLGPEIYSVFGSLVAITYLISILGQSIDITTTKYISELIGKNSGIKIIYISFFKKSLVLSLLITTVLVLVSPILSTTLNIDTKLLILIAVCFIFNITTSVNIGCLKGLERFGSLSGINISGHIIKLTVGTSLILLGYGVYGAIGGFLAASIFIFTTSSFLILQKSLNNSKLESKTSYYYNIYNNIYKYAFHSLLLAFCMNVPTNIDVIFVKSLFTEYEAGLYTAASIFGKIQFFFSTSMIWALFPKVSKKNSIGVKTHRLLNRAVLYIGLISGLLAVTYYFFPVFLIDILYGHQYLTAAKFIKLYGVVMFLFSLFAVIVNYYMAKGESRFVSVFSAVIVTEIIGFTIFHSAPVDFIKIMILGNFIGLIILLFLSVFLIKE